jgi:hypothetical protein
MQFVIVLFIHFKFELAPPLILQTAMNPIRFYKVSPDKPSLALCIDLFPLVEVDASTPLWC